MNIFTIHKAYLIAIALLVLGQSLFAGGNEGASSLEDLPPEVIVCYLLPQLGNRELGRLALTSHWAAELVREELEKRHTDHRIRELAGRALSPDLSDRTHPAREIGDLLASSETSLTQQQVEMLLTLLIGDDGHGGLAGDEYDLVRTHVVKAIGTILASREGSEGVRLRLLNALIGGDGHRGLIGNEGSGLRWDVTNAIGTILASGECSEEERSRLLCELIGVDGHSGLSGDRHWLVRKAVAEGIGIILGPGKCVRGERLRLLTVLNQLAEDENQKVREQALIVKCIQFWNRWSEGAFILYNPVTLNA